MTSPQVDILGSRLAAALLRSWPGSRVCAWVRQHVDDDEPVDLAALADGLRIEPAARQQAIDHARRDADAALADARTRGFTLVALGQPGYPARLADIHDPPLVLWTRGPVALDGSTVAIVGSRHASQTGLAMASDLARDLARSGYTVVSGMAAGIDGAAHVAALEAGGLTMGVLGCGIDIVYPAAHARLAQAMAERGCLVSEFPPGTGPRPHHFPLRNRIISGLSRAVVLVEAGEKSGSLITANAAIAQGREVMAVPGSVLSRKSAGCHALIRDGARLVEGARDVIEELEGVSAASAGGAEDKPLFLNCLESLMDRSIVYSLDELVAKAGRGPSELLTELTQLEIDGRIVRAGAGGFVRP